MNQDRATQNTALVPAALQRILAELPPAALGFSGGVDSSYLLFACLHSGLKTRAYTVYSQFQPQFELDDARRLVQELGADLSVLELDVLHEDQIRLNAPNRCYYCKQLIFGAIRKQALADGFTVLLDGSNASDVEDDRPGMKALSELAVRSPLREAGLKKDQIRSLSRQAGLFTWDKPAYACLATRVPVGTELEAETIRKIERAEAALRALGFSDLRVRTDGHWAKIQLPQSQFAAAVAQQAEIVQTLSRWFDQILLDLKPR